MRHERALKTLEELEREHAFVAPPEAERGYGNDPNLVTPSAPWSGTLTEHQLKLIAALSDVVLPKTSQYPAPSKIGIAEFFDHWLSAPYQTQQSHREVIVKGLSSLDPISTDMFGAEFMDLTTAQKKKIVDHMIGAWPVADFFKRFRYLVIGGYFTTDLGSEIIGYVGNVPMREYLGVPDNIKELIDKELKKLGL